MPSYKLTYFDGRGRGELARCIFNAAGVKFEDVRLKFEEWPAKKAEAMYGTLPELVVDGKFKLAQSSAIVRYLAKTFKLAGTNLFEEALVDQYIELVTDIFTEFIKVMFEKDDAKKSELQKKLSEETIPKFIRYFERDLEKNGGQFLVGKKLTAADIAVQNVFDSLMQKDPSAMDKFPKFKAHRALVHKTPKLDKYLQTRVKSDF